MNNELVPYPSWWKRNWKWFLPVSGCLGMIFIMVFFVGSLFYGITTMFEGADPYEHAIEKINRDDEIIGLLGSPIVKDGMINGSLNWHNGDGKADMTIPISGPKGNGTLYINASSSGDNWTYHEIRVVVKDNEEIEILQEELEAF